MWGFFKRKQFGTGGLDDPRGVEAKEKDFKAEEAVAFGAVDWREKPENDWRKYPIFNQDGSGSCVAMSKAKELGILNYLEEGIFIGLSPRDIYVRRGNKPYPGMWGQDANEVVRKVGATLEYLMPSMERDEMKMNLDGDRKPSFEVLAKIYRAKAWFNLAFDIDKIAQILDTGVGVNLFLRWDYEEWDREAPEIRAGSARANHHSIVAVDRTLYKGKRALVIEDSWGANRGINGRRVLTEEWMERLTWASYLVNLSNLEMLNGGVEKPKYVFKRNLKTGDTGYDVGMLQRCLGYLKDEAGWLFPLSQEPTGNYYGLTRKAVERFQKVNGLNVDGIVGDNTRAKLNEIFV